MFISTVKVFFFFVLNLLQISETFTVDFKIKTDFRKCMFESVVTLKPSGETE